jgi:predicted permease
MSIFLDIKYALRLLYKSPKFTALTLSVLVGGLSISLFTFSFLYSTLYKSLPLPEGDSALRISVVFEGNYQEMTAYEFSKISEKQQHLAELGLYANSDIRLSFDEAGKNLPVSYVDGGFFHFSRTKPILGRTIQSADMKAGANPVTVISYELWQNELAANKDILNSSIRLNDIKTDIIGVMPQGYRFPDVAKIWLPLAQNKLNALANVEDDYSVYARLKDHTNIEQATLAISSDLNKIYQQNVKLYNFPPGDKTVNLSNFPIAQMAGQGTLIFSFLNTIAWFILLLACINVGNLLLARAIERRKETAIRAALGASSKRLVSQLMWEGSIITIIGGVLSVLLVGAALDYTEVALHSWSTNNLVFWWHWGLDIETVLMAIFFTAVTILLSSFLPAWRSANQDINSTLRDGTRSAQSKKAGKLSRFLVTTQVFIVAILMLVGAMSGFISHKLINLDLGDDYSHVMKATVNLPHNKYLEKQEQALLYQSLLEEIESHPEVVGAVAQNYSGYHSLTLTDFDYNDSVEKSQVDTFSFMGDPSSLGMKMIAGRHFTSRDNQQQRKVALISQSMANRYWAGEDPLEKKIQLTINEKRETLSVIGVISDRMNPRSLFSKLDTQDEVYLSTFQFIERSQIIYYQTNAISKNMDEIFYQALFNIDRSIEIFESAENAEGNRNLMRDSMRLISNITFATGFFALLLALVGIYGLTANSVAQRTHEIGIRRAVGATDSSIIKMFFKQGLKQLTTGLGLALVIFTLIAFGFHSFSQGIFPLPLYFILAATVVVGLSCIVMLAIYAPTRAAVAMEPSSALRHE